MYLRENLQIKMKSFFVHYIYQNTRIHMCVCPLCVLGVGWVGGSPILLLWGGKRVEACMGSGHAVFTWIENTHAYTLHPMFSNINNTLLVIFVP